MKKAFLSPRLALGLAVALVSLSVGVLVSSCQKESFGEDPASSAGSQPQGQQAYLDFTAGYSGTGTLSAVDWAIFSQVMQRVKISQVDGLWQMNAQSAEDINVSPEVFSFLIQAIENSNTRLVPDVNNMRVFPVRRFPGEDPDLQDPTLPFDCGPRCVGFINQVYKFGPSYDSAYNHMINRFGQGIPSDSMGSFLKDLYGPSHVSPFPATGQAPGSWFNESGAAVILNIHPDGDTTAGHAMIYQGTGADSVLYGPDPQNGNLPRFVNPGDVISSFKITK